MGADSATWSAVIDEIATTTRTCAHDRAGRGRSDPIARHTLSDATTDLADLLDLAGEPGPYVLVGHSLGGTYVRVFAAANRADVDGIVLVDSFDPDIQSAVVHPLLGPFWAEYEADLDRLRDVASRVESLDWPASETQLRAASIAGLPIEVLVAPRAEPRLDGVQNARIADASRAAYEALSPGLVRQTTAWGAGHQIQVDRPDLVIDAVRRIVETARRDRRAAISGRAGNLRDPALVFTEVPDIDIRWLDPEGRQGRADLASMIRPVLQRLGESDADRGVSLRAVVTLPHEDRSGSGSLARTPDQTTSLPAIVARRSGSSIPSSSIRGTRPPLNECRYERSAPTMWRTVSRMEP